VSLGRWFGIEIRLEPSWFVIFVLLTFSLSGMLAAAHPDLAPSVHWTVALLGSVFFFGSILTHEMAHSLVAMRSGVRVHSITLHIFGGVSRLGSEAKCPWDEFLIAIVGPATSFALGALFLGVAQVIPPPSIGNCVASWLGYVNLALAAFNLLPGFPLDGGRVLRAIIWAVKRDSRKADAVAFMAGRVVAYGLILVGVTLAFGLRQYVSGLWLGFIGWFLLSAAQSSRVQSALREILGRLHASDVMRAPQPFMSPETLVSTAVNEHVLKTGQRTFYVSDEGRFLGLVTLHELKKVPREDWRLLTLRDLLIPPEELARVSPSDSLVQAFEKLDEEHVNQIPVMEGNALVGILNREDMLRLVSSHLELKGEGRQ
jgi:Zn-dependent protease/CBS domain-containing protein